MPSFIDRLNKEARFFLFARSLFSLVIGFLAWSGLLFLLDLYDAYAPIREADALFWLVMIGVLSLIIILGLFLYSWIRRPSLQNLASKVESTNPALRDLLNTAVEIEQKSTPPNLMERRALLKMGTLGGLVNWRQSLGLGSSFWNLLAIGFACGVLVSWWNIERSPVKKMFDSLSGDPGIVVTTGLSNRPQERVRAPDAEFRRGADVSIFAEILRPHRGEVEAWLETKSSGLSTRTPMISGPSLNQMEFLLPAITERIDYRITTQSLESEWYALTPFDPPVLEFASWDIVPPSYMNLEKFSHDGFGFIKVPEGSEVNLVVRTDIIPPNIAAKFYAKEGNSSLQKQGNVTFSWEHTLVDEWRGQLSLQDLDFPHRPEVLHDEVILSPIPDNPPLVEITDPAKDLELAVDADPLLIEVYASDDFGVADIRLHVSHDGEKFEDALFVDPVEREKAVTGIMDLNNYALAVGDVLTYMAFAVDNKEPEGQIARSEVYFIEILPPEGNTSDSQFEGGDMGQDTKEIPVREFINRTKKMIRDTYDAMLDEGSEREKQSLEISSDALELKHDMTKVYDEFEGQFPIVDGLDLGELLNEATYHIEQTEIYAGEEELELSLEPTEKTLRKLVQLYAFLQEMEKQKAKGQGQQQKSKGEEGEQQEETEHTQNSEDPSEKLKELARDLEEIKEFEQRQDQINQEIGQAVRSGREGQRNQDLSEDQEGLRRDLESFKDRKYERTGRLGDVSELEEAGSEMKEGAGDLRRDRPQDAQPHGELAADALGRAKQRINREMSQIAADMIDQLTKQAEQLGSAQSQLRKESVQASSGQGQGLKEEQDAINQEINDLLKKIDQTARSLGKYQERATEDLLKSLAEAKEEGLEKSGRRASNSLLYEGFPQAGSEQEKVEDALGGLEDDLQGVEDKLRNENNPELANFAEHLEEMQERSGSLGEKELREMNEEAARSIGNLPQSDEDERLLNLTRMFEAAAFSEDINNVRSLSAGAVEQATQLIEQFFWQEAVESHLQRNLRATTAPARYRKQVEEYFRRIAEGK